MKNIVIKVLNHLGYKYQIIVDKPQQTIIRLGMQLDNGRADIYIDIRPEQEQVLISAVSPVIVPAHKRNAIAEFITRANFGLIIGSFEMDYNDGELKYKCNFLYDEDDCMSEKVFARNLLISFHTLDKYLPGIMTVLYANVMPHSAIAQIENAPDHNQN
ncbi:MAG TPA: YbjN domain-containing protein [Chitinophagales bacterium]|nr:YbjN domain-containing protein [Chitinophagales bacterium]HRK28996.1 YbjN domain-containing protein [Chitinophagales bacterium]